MLFALTACDDSGSNSSVPYWNPVTEREALKGTTVTIDGEIYDVRRQKLTYRDGRTSIGWAVIYDGRTISCSQPNEGGCRAAIEDAKENPLINDGGEGGMY